MLGMLQSDISKIGSDEMQLRMLQPKNVLRRANISPNSQDCFQVGLKEILTSLTSKARKPTSPLTLSLKAKPLTITTVSSKASLSDPSCVGAKTMIKYIRVSNIIANV